jgi:hypothetical protein
LLKAFCELTVFMTYCSSLTLPAFPLGAFAVEKLAFRNAITDAVSQDPLNSV